MALKQLASSSRPLWALGPRVGPSLPCAAPWPIFVAVTVRVFIAGHSWAPLDENQLAPIPPS
jgi:hypothetical protein